LGSVISNKTDQLLTSWLFVTASIRTRVRKVHVSIIEMRLLQASEMTENWWYVWRAVTLDGTFDNECHVVRYDNKYAVEQHLVLEKCLRYETWVLWDDGYTINVKCLTNNKPAFDRHVWSDKFEDWFDRITWYAKRVYETAPESMTIDGITALCLFNGGEKLETILCGQQDNCLCENLPLLTWLKAGP
jgi:hypothetical protein